MLVRICVGSSCHLKGSEKVVELFRAAVKERGLEDSVTLAGNFCAGKCNRDGVTVTVEDDVYTGVTPQNFAEFFEDKIAGRLKREGV